MSSALLECVPNFSAGRKDDFLPLACRRVQSRAGVELLDAGRDPDHNRSVLTFAGEPTAVVEALMDVAEWAVERIDLRRHRGVHPRIGALDVAPFVPLSGLDWEQTVELAHDFGEQLWTRLGVPVYFFGRAARTADRQRLEDVRRGQFEGLHAAAGLDPQRLPDIGGPAPHATAGATAVGVRPPLIAFNVNLAGGDAGPARRIARAIRESSGGLPAVKALGLELRGAGITQVSMNLTDYAVTSPAQVFDRITQLAAAEGVEVIDSELIGLIPRAALPPEGPDRLRIRDFSPLRVLEERLGL